MLKIYNEQLIIRYFEEVWNQGKLDVLDEIISADYINHNPGIANKKIVEHWRVTDDLTMLKQLSLEVL